MASCRPASRLLVEAAEQLHRLLGVGAGVGVPGLVPELLVERLADRVEDRLLGRAHGALGVAEDLAGDRLGLLHQALVGDDLGDQAPLQRLLGVHRLGGEQHVRGDATPQALTRRTRPPSPWWKPRRASKEPNIARSEAIRMSQASAVSRPPASAQPLTAPMIGL